MRESEKGKGSCARGAMAAFVVTGPAERLARVSGSACGRTARRTAALWQAADRGRALDPKVVLSMTTDAGLWEGMSGGTFPADALSQPKGKRCSGGCPGCPFAETKDRRESRENPERNPCRT
eukprot:CAMPEP_0198311688 /NCGR_PEP_ID=MMETSP1450-20131203/3336_1 /TAXON_ID=753684 ORGANISM="Madagascaria erythrocladiodes, Strain CCMP3234" /NCGR_SAMPLE_ID=MMETSP1450 /ASSEMBLY_ACC=CAM_ASM_001115 /LENGTH=121 /DNA_ID=CAMNT_0044014593 /DNA_START=71 /DNA_END=439 /DNA_ORIENTATION=-